MISIRRGSLGSQANTDKLCNNGGTGTRVIYPSRSQSAPALQEAPLLPPPQSPLSLWLLKDKGNRKSGLLLNLSSLQGE